MNIQAPHNPAESRLRWSELHPLSIRYRPGELVYHTGSYAAGAGMVLSGVIMDLPGSATTSRPTTPDLDLVGPDDLFGVEVLVSPPLDVHRTSGRALTEVEVAFVERETLRQALSTDLSLSGALLSHVVARFLRTKTQDRLPGRSSRDADHSKGRLANCLLQLAQKCGTVEDDHQRLVRLPKEITARTLSSILAISGAKIVRLLADPDLSAAEPRVNPKSEFANGEQAEGLLIAVDKLLQLTFLPD
ncbi:Crp/Fnr family transcriptional regulator [Candidatus Bipolaricaulota bacterium]|nr:Crp/Fnr family transcriptional regulator [Candidatus Bipolaricaulota bacterium]